MGKTKQVWLYKDDHYEKLEIPWEEGSLSNLEARLEQLGFIRIIQLPPSLAVTKEPAIDIVGELLSVKPPLPIVLRPPAERSARQALRHECPRLARRMPAAH